MSSNGTKFPHSKTVGYVVTMPRYGYVGTVCHGVTDPSKRTFLGGNPATLFPTRKAAQRVIDEAKTQPDNADVHYSILRVAHLL